MKSSDYRKRAVYIAGTVSVRSDYIAAASTAPGLYCTDLTTPIAAYAENPDSYVKPIMAALVRNPSLQENDFYRVSNSVIACVLEARNTLLINVLQAISNPLLSNKLKVINNMGEALDVQVGRDQGIFDQGTEKNIHKRMGILKIPSHLIEAYRALHIYYLSSKHRDESRYKRALEELSTPSGTAICAKYYECVRKILVWHYRQSGAPLFKELDAIDFGKYNLSI